MGKTAELTQNEASMSASTMMMTVFSTTNPPTPQSHVPHPSSPPPPAIAEFTMAIPWSVRTNKTVDVETFKFWEWGCGFT